MTSRRAEPLPGDAHARFTALVREHQRDLFAHVRVVYPHVDADTVVNEVFVAAWQRIDDVPDDRAATWLRATARYVVSNRRRGERRWQALNDRVARLESVGYAPAPDHDAGLELHLVLDALASLSSSDREVLLMTAIDDLTPEDVGEILGVKGHTAAVRISRARARLRAAVAARTEHPEQGGTA
ncbi:MAG: sigma-70 family RNA polymerase sigma factor [Acidimicrobiales bacterium]